MPTSVALALRRLRIGASWGLACALAFFLLEVGAGVRLGELPSARAAKHKPVKRHSTHKPKGRRVAIYPPLRDGYGVTGLGAATALATTATPTSKNPPSPQPVVSSPPPRPLSPRPAQPKTLTLQAKRGKNRPAAPPSDSEVLDEAQNAYVDGERQRAINIALTVAEKESPQAEAAWRFIGLAACSVRSNRMATRAFQNLHAPSDQRTITNACKVNGMSLHDDQFVRD